MLFYNDWAAIVPMANEAADFGVFMGVLRPLLDRLGSGKIYFVLDNASKDNTLALCQAVSAAGRALCDGLRPREQERGRCVPQGAARGLRGGARDHHRDGRGPEPRSAGHPDVPARAQRGQRVRVWQPLSATGAAWGTAR